MHMCTTLIYLFKSWDIIMYFTLGYLKLYQLSSPTLVFDCILVDEAQDFNPGEYGNCACLQKLVRACSLVISYNDASMLFLYTISDAVNFGETEVCKDSGWGSTPTNLQVPRCSKCHGCSSS